MDKSHKELLSIKIKEHVGNNFNNNHYFSLGSLLYNQGFLYAVTKVVVNYIKELIEKHAISIDCIGGVGYDVLPITTATLIKLWEDSLYNDIYGVCIKNEIWEYGIKTVVEGKINRNDQILIVDDIINTKEAVNQTIKICQNVGLVPVAMISIIDRSGGLQTVDELLNYKYIFTLDELRKK